eukprot:4706779-Heterocapsa_arctica.AAC.1
MPAGYTVCMSSRCPFVFEALKGSEKRCIKAPLTAAAKVAGTGTIPKPVEQPGQSSSSKAPRSFTPPQLAKAEQGPKSLRTGQSDINGCLKRVLIYRQKWDTKTAQYIIQYGRD